MNLINLFTAQNADGTSIKVMVGSDEDNPGLERIVSVQGGGSWNGATVKLEFSNDPEAESASWAPGQIISEGALVDLEFTDDFYVNVKLNPFVGLRAVVSGSGSPQPAINVSARGNIVAIA